MAFDQTTRGRLQKFVTDARELLSNEFVRQLQNDFGMDPGTGAIDALEKLTHIDDAKLETALMLRDTFAHYSESGSGGGAKDVINRIVREQAFTVLNRLCAVRMAEARNIIIQSIGDGYNSKGFQLYSRVAATALGDKGTTYKSFIYGIFDELATDLAVLFDRFSPMGRLFPKESVLMELLALINGPEMVPLWAEDETIGWIYQYFNSIEERKKMRAESQAPRNSRELAVRNQFFTPRYVVEFLTDNTLGRIWYEMTRGNTVLKDTCRYLVRRPNEIFLNEGEEAPPQAEAGEELSQEELIRRPVHIAFRPLKDPRVIRMLDPACGSMHFGLYAFDLFEHIYMEAWDIETVNGAAALLRDQNIKPLTEIYSGKDEFIKDIPRLIIENNIHGVDIDPRAVQIAGLSLWLRAQKNWNDQNLKYAARPRIRKANIVCAEPMPGESDMLKEFTSALKPKILGSLVEHIFDKMKLAGEAGSLLKIEEEIQDAVEKAREKYNEEMLESKASEGFLPGVDMSRDNTLFDFAELPDRSSFWDTAEDKIITALKEYSERSETLTGSRHRLFAEDAAKGFAFIDICRKRYDVVLMNPPFGDAIPKTEILLENNFKYWCKNLASAFVTMSFERCNYLGHVGVVADRTIIVKSSYENFRYKIHKKLSLLADLGWDVLDANVEVTSMIFSNEETSNDSLFFDERLSIQKNIDLFNQIFNIQKSELTKNYYKLSKNMLASLPNCAFAYDMPFEIVNIFKNQKSLIKNNHRALQGHNLSMEQFGRLSWEVPVLSIANRTFVRMYKGGEYSKFYQPSYEVALWLNNGNHLRSHSGTRWGNEKFQEKPCLGYGKRGDFLDAHIMPAGHIFTVEGLAIFPNDISASWGLLAVLNSKLCSYLLHFYSGQHKMSGYLELLPVPSEKLLTLNCAEKAKSIFIEKFRFDTQNELSSNFIFWSFLDKNHKTINSVSENLLKKSNKIRQEGDILDDIVTNVYGICDKKLYNDEFVKTRPMDVISIAFDCSNTKTICICLSETLIHYSIGTIFARWDIRYATGEKTPPELPDPFAPLPVCPPGMLQNSEGLPAAPEDIPDSYPLRLTWSGIIVDDEGHKEDIVSRVREAMEVIWKDKAADIEHEACEILGIKSLRDYFRNSNNFFAQHLKRYSKSRRQAPIYWPLSTASGAYTLWLYYHRLTDQTLYTCVNDFVDPKIKLTDETIEALRRKTSRSRLEEAELEKLTTLAAELKDFREELLRIAKFWKPDLNDGVQITAAPLWDLFALRPWKKTLKETWTKLEKGDYDWAHLAYSIRPEQVKEKCRTDKSLAIAHDLEHLYEEPKGGAKKKRAKKAVTGDLEIEETEGAE